MWALAISAAVHVVLLLSWRIVCRLPDVAGRGEQLIVLGPPTPHPPPRDMPFVVSRPPEATSRRLGPHLVPTIAPVERPPQTLRVVPPPEPPTDSGPTESAGPLRLRPGLASGRLWVRPLPLPPQELAQRLERTPAQLADSAVTAIVQAFLDSVAAEPGSDQIRLPSWTREIAGKTFGLDAKYLYIGDLKIPAVVLALLPLPSGSNESEALDHQMRLMREDLRYAARRAQTVAQFKEAIRDLREETERRRAFERNRRTPPPATPSKDSVP